MEIVLKNDRKLIVREAAEEDAKKLNEFLRKIILETDQFGYEPEEFNISLEQQQFTINMFSQTNNAALLVAVIDGQIVGRLSFRAGGSKKFSHVGELGVDVLKEYWNLGIGRELIKYLISWARESKIIKKISLRVREDNANAIALYSKLGFQQEGILRKEIMSRGKLYNVIYMGMLMD